MLRRPCRVCPHPPSQGGHGSGAALTRARSLGTCQKHASFPWPCFPGEDTSSGVHGFSPSDPRPVRPHTARPQGDGGGVKAGGREIGRVMALGGIRLLTEARPLAGRSSFPRDKSRFSSEGEDSISWQEAETVTSIHWMCKGQEVKRV